MVHSEGNCLPALTTHLVYSSQTTSNTRSNSGGAPSSRLKLPRLDFALSEITSLIADLFDRLGKGGWIYARGTISSYC